MTGNGSSLVSFQRVLATNKNLSPSFDPHLTELTTEEVRQHRSPSDCWTIFDGNVYDLSPFLEYHPGGFDQIMRGAGNDCTELYNKYHPWVSIEAVLGPLKLGRVKSSNSTHSLGRISSPVREHEPGHIHLNVGFTSPFPTHIRTKDVLRPSIGIFKAFESVSDQSTLRVEALRLVHPYNS